MKIISKPSLELRNTSQRLAALLMQRARTDDTRQAGYSQREMAEDLNVSREMVSRAFRSLKSTGGIRIDRHRMLLNAEVLEHIAAGNTDARVYVLLRTRDCDVSEAAALLRRQPGVVMADGIEGQPDVIFEVQARDRENLARLTLLAMAKIEDLTEEIQLLPVRV